MSRKSRYIRHKTTYWGEETRYDKRIGTSPGKLCVLHTQPIEAVDGQLAYPVIWISDLNCKVVQRRGFTRPVDFVKLRGEVNNPFEGMPEPDAPDEHWDDWYSDNASSMGIEELIERQMYEIQNS